MYEKKTWHVTTVEGVFVKDYGSEAEATASALDRNLRSGTLGSSAKYVVAEKP
jgi:hypothetical protein